VFARSRSLTSGMKGGESPVTVGNRRLHFLSQTELFNKPHSATSHTLNPGNSRLIRLNAKACLSTDVVKIAQTQDRKSVEVMQVSNNEIMAFECLSAKPRQAS